MNSIQKKKKTLVSSFPSYVFFVSLLVVTRVHILQATSYDLTSDDEDIPPRPKKNGFDAWSSDSSSHHSFDGPSTARFPPSTLPPNPRKMTSAGKQAASLKAKEDVVPKARQSYLGPIVTDPDEPLSEEQEFERFKMHVRFQKIMEFHQAAAHADIELAIAIYKDRMAQNSDKHEVSSKVTNHQKRMMQLQMEKEEERKNIVKAERSKRRSELRRRPGRSGTLVAPRPSVPANPSWLNAFQEQVSEEVESNIVLDKILSSNDPDEQEGHVEKLLERLLPGSSSLNEDRQNHFARDEYSSTGENGWGTSTASLPRANHEVNQVTPKRLSNGRFTKHNNNNMRVKPSLFGEDPESSDEEEEEDSPSPPVSVNPAPAPPQQANPFMNADADSMLMADPELFSYINQWGTTGELPSVPSPTTAWGMTHAQTPTVDNPDPWRLMKDDVRSTPVATRRKTSFSASLNTPTQNPYNNAFMAEQPGMPMPMSLATLAVLNSANASVREKQPVLEPVKRVSPPQTTPAPAGAPSSNSASPVTPPQGKTDPSPIPLTGKKSGKKQRQAKKAGAGGPSTVEDSSTTQVLELLEPPTETTPMATIFEKTPPPPSITKPDANPNFNASAGASTSRGRKDSTSTWNELLSTPRPTSNIPAHLLEKAGVNKPVEQFRSGSGSGMSTIKGPQRGSGLKNTARSAWNIFSTAEPGPSKVHLSGDREHWIPGGFEVDDGDGGGGGQEDINEGLYAQFLAAAPPALHKSSMPNPALRSNDISPPSNASSSKPVPTMSSQLPPVLSPAGKKGKNKKGKTKKVTVEEVPDEEEDNRGERLPVDHRYIMESRNTILEPRPSVPPRMYDSIIGFGDGDDDDESGRGGGSMSSSFVSAADTAPSSSSPIDHPFDGDPARFAAAMQEIQEASARMEKKFTAPPVWGVGNNNKTKSSYSEAESSSSSSSAPVFSWGQPIVAAADKKKGNASASTSNPVGNNLNNVPATKPPAIVQNLKRSKAGASGGKLL